MNTELLSSLAVSQGDGLIHPRELEDEAPYRAYLFGDFKVFRGNQEMDLAGTGRQRAMHILQWFLLNPGRPCSADEFADRLWPDRPTDKALGNFHVSVHALRRMLEPDLRPRQESKFIRRQSNRMYVFDSADAWWTDAVDMERCFWSGQQSDQRGQTKKACFYYRRAASYANRGLLAGCEESEWLERDRRRYGSMWSQSLIRLMQLHQIADDDDELVECAYQLLQIDPYNELATKAIVEASLRAGQLRRATRRLERFCTSIQTDLGMSPCPELAELRAQIVHPKPPPMPLAISVSAA